ncbi:MAG: nitrilase, partial [Pseudomonadota bacterium]
DAMSKIVDYDGKVMAEAQSGESMNANAVIDLPALRARRRRTGMSHMLARQPLDLYRAAYADPIGAAPNSLRAGGMEERAAIIARQRALIDQMINAGVIR